MAKFKCLLLLSVLFFGSCSNLDEELYGSLSPENYYQTEEEALSSVVGVYDRMGDVVNYGQSWRASVLGTDEFIIAARSNGGWFDGGIFHEYTTHTVSPTNGANNSAWETVFSVIGAANAVLQSLEDSPQSDELTAVKAEVRALRAYAYFYAMDFWGNVPIFTDARIDPTNLPATNSRTEVFDFVTSEMLAATAELPSVTEVDRASYYPRFTKEAIYAALAAVYLNGEVYTGQEYWTEAIDMADRVINSNAYILEPEFIANFTGNNHNSMELISAFTIEPALDAGGNTYFRGAMHPLHQLAYGTPFVPAGGFSTFEDVLERYEENDVRRQYIVHGPQTYPNGDPLLDANGKQLELIPIIDYTNAELNEGYRVLKYVPDGNWVGRNANNDIVLMRYADVLLIKAEALLRLGNESEALNLVNQVRRRSNAEELSTLTLKDIEEERAREFVWEGHRRRDMIRFGTYFTDTWKFKTTPTPEWRGIYPIPALQITANPSLQQNPNY